MRAEVDYKRRNGGTSREEYLWAYEPGVHLDAFAYAMCINQNLLR